MRLDARSIVALLACLVATLAPHSGYAGKCFAYGGGVTLIHPGVLLLEASGETLPNNSNERIPFAAIYVGQDDLFVGVQGDPAAAPETGVAECHERSGAAIAQSDDTGDLTSPSIASNAEYEAQIVDGKLELRATAGVAQGEAIDNMVNGSNAEVEIGFREVFDVASGELGMQDLQIDWKLSEADTVRRIATWPLPGHLVVMGVQQVDEAGVTRRDPYLVSIDLKTGGLRAAKLTD